MTADLIGVLVVWYFTVQLVALASLPLTLGWLDRLPDRGYSLSKIAGIVLVGVLFWLGYAYGLLRNERGGAWIALMVVAGVAWGTRRQAVRAWWRDLRTQGNWRGPMVTELLFVAAFVVWAVVRAYDPAADHTEQPMDLMFMNSLWASVTFPPQDAWLAGYSISYYYLGYWLMTTIGRLANLPPNLAYNLAQATWYGLLWIGCFGVVMNLLAWRFDRRELPDLATEQTTFRLHGWSLGGGLLAGVMVALAGNLWAVVEWLYAQGVNVTGLARWVDVDGFPENAAQTGLWFIGHDWWWWRTSRVIEDLNLQGGHLEVIAEFPMFSYLLGDNHPHVVAMPVVLLVIAAAFNLLLHFVAQREQAPEARSGVTWRSLGRNAWLYGLVVGSLLFLNTWDFPPYWVLMSGVAVFGLAHRHAGGRWSGAVAGGLLLGAVLLYLPYFLTAQSQAGGVMVNLYNPTRLPQFLVMFGAFVPAVIGLLALGRQVTKPTVVTVLWVAGAIFGSALLILGATSALVDTGFGQRAAMQMDLPDGVTSYAAMVLARWGRDPWTLLVTGAGLVVGVASLVTLLRRPALRGPETADLLFALLLVVGGLALVYVPEFLFLRDFFGTRMNTVFKFYYQAWLLFGLASAYFVVVALRGWRTSAGRWIPLAALTLVLTSVALIFPVAGIYSKTGGFRADVPTLDATAYLARSAPEIGEAVAWVAANTTADARVLEGAGASYWASHNRVSAMTGRPTLLGWVGHERQWRGQAYGEMAAGREAAIELIYRTGRPDEIAQALAAWEIEYVFVGPTEIEQYGITEMRLNELASVMEPVFRNSQVMIFRRRA
jgi:YYY domain-containing protein